jgi:predicted phage terminase large subunit-like protein
VATIAENRWIPRLPTAKQSEFLLRADVAEILFGGAAGGGKSEALLAAALQFVDHPGYSAILFRRTYSDLALPGALMDRSSEWLRGTAAKWNSDTKTWLFPSGATLTFGYLDIQGDKYRYQSAEFSFIGFDELTQFPEQDYLYLFSRLRRKAGSPVPMRMRAASNPGGIGHAWVKRRFEPNRSKDGQPFAAAEGRVFIPARLTDNPHLDGEQYRKSLENLDPFTRRQLLHGSWEEFSGNHFSPLAWPRFRDAGDAFVLEPRRLVLHADTWRFLVCDPAVSAGRRSDYTAIVVFAVVPGGDLLVLDVVRAKLDVRAIVPALAEVCRRWRPLSFAALESVAFSRLLVREASRNPDIPGVHEVKPAGKGKLARAVAAIVKGERNEIHLPADDPPWLDEFVSELAAFTGLNDAHDDQVDCLAYGVIAASMFRPTSEASMPIVLIPGRDDPTAGGGLWQPRRKERIEWTADGQSLPPPSMYRPGW